MYLSRRAMLAGLASLGLAPLITPASAAQVTATTPEPTARTGMKTFRIGVPAKAMTTDPAVTNDIETHRLARQVCQNLIGADEETGETSPQLAADSANPGDGRQVARDRAEE